MLEINNAYEIRQADPDSQWRLKNCQKCKSDQAVYVRVFDSQGNLVWKVKCLHCEAETEERFVQHDAQMLWNSSQIIT